MKDFTLITYRKLLITLKNAGYAFFTFEEWCDGKAEGRYVILRHDVDLKAAHSLATAQMEAEVGVRATYYFRIVPQSNQPEIIRAIAALGHEIGYHYEDLSLFSGDEVKAIKHFEKQLAHFRQFYPVRTICMHGSPTSRFDNRDLWKTYNYRDYGIIGEPYFDFLSPLSKNNGAGAGVTYFTDTARMWDGDKFNIRDKPTHQKTDLSIQPVNQPAPHIHTTFDFINWLNTHPVVNTMMITIHPQRWTDNKFEWVLELIKQRVKNQIKRIILINN